MALNIHLPHEITNILRAASLAADPPASLIPDARTLDAATQKRILDAYQQGAARVLAIVALAFGVVPQGATAAEVRAALESVAQE